VLVVSPPSVSGRHAQQQRSLGVLLAKTFSGDTRFNYLDLEGRRFGDLINAQGGVDSLPPTADAEVPLSGSCIVDFDNAVQARTHSRHVLVYTSPGTYSGWAHGNALLWVAAYGPTTPPCLWRPCVAFQYSDGIYGPYPHTVGGLTGDSDLDTGLLALIGPACDRACEKRKHDHKIRVWEHQLHTDLVLRGQIRTHLLKAGCRVKHYRTSPPAHDCRVLFRAGAAVNHEIAVLRHDLTH